MTRVFLLSGLFLINLYSWNAIQPLHANDIAWTMVVVPDTQNYRSGNGHLQELYDTMQWIVDNKETRNIEIVASQGDFTSNRPVDWVNQANAWGTLNGEVPYIVVTGNHDYDPFGKPIADHDATLINEYFAVADNPLNSITTERIPGRIENSYTEFQAPDGRNMLVFSLEWQSRPEVLDWANSIAGQSQFANHTAVVLTHGYLREGHLNPDGTDNAFRTEEDGEPMWNGLVRHHENFELVSNGHYLDWNDDNPYGPLTTGRQTSIGDNGNVVHEIVFNAQEQPNGGNGYIRLMEFMNDGSTVQVRTYSPTLDVWLTNDRNEFQFQLTPLFSADFDGDDDIDGSDFLAWQRGFGSTEFSPGDANNDGMINSLDLAIWQQQYATDAALSSTLSIPEPQTVMLFSVAFALCFSFFRRGVLLRKSIYMGQRTI
ncbi:metallophosphoesterase [Bythopirellula goksoeyrii]|uniref:Calcineurin-like phosphoesterase domain-containing protein n=1 Tax=Bythopirellula goksoeyrii TaxID=1400387 RepID=A0A5B9QAD8_9BACT|nr:metallophosphoesterase [Bythopirellula goksoeyrii]QEG34709.1 hypothetical protein Pr1d_19910 [Bythopirellula goksoeyrii]